MERLSFDVNVALRGGYAEVVAQREASKKMTGGQVTNRQQALDVIRRARADVIEMEAEREKRKSKA